MNDLVNKPVWDVNGTFPTMIAQGLARPSGEAFCEHGAVLVSDLNCVFDIKVASALDDARRKQRTII